MSEENNSNSNEENNNAEAEKQQQEFNDFLAKYKETEDFKKYVDTEVKTANAKILSNRDDLLKENSELKKVKARANEDEVAKLIMSGKEEDRQKAVELLSGEVTSKYQKLLDDKETELNSFKEKEQAYAAEKEKEFVSGEFKKLEIFSKVREDAVNDFIMPQIYANFKMKEGKLTYTGKEINSKGKPLTLEEYTTGFLTNNKFFLKEKQGSGLFAKTTEENGSTTSSSRFEDRMRNKGKIKD